MKLNKNERLVPVFEVTNEGIQELNVHEIRDHCSRVEGNPEPLNLELRDRVTEIEFDARGFRELGVRVRQTLTTTVREEQERLLHTTLSNYTVQHSLPDGTIVVTPNYIVNIKDEEVFNVFDSFKRMKYYNFLTDVTNGKGNEWKIVTAIDREIKISLDAYQEELFGPQPPAITQETTDFDLPFDEVEKALKENQVSLTLLGLSLVRVTQDYALGKIGKQDLTVSRLKHHYNLS